jgi:hypothetical protein
LEHPPVLVAVMLPSQTLAPWQVGPVSPTSRIAVTALVALAVNSLFVWQTTPHLIEGWAVTVIPILIAIRVARGFSGALAAAALAFVASGSTAAWTLSQGSNARPARATAAIAAGAVIAAIGLSALMLGWFQRRRRPERAPVVLRLVHETHDFLRRTSRTG